MCKTESQAYDLRDPLARMEPRHLLLVNRHQTVLDPMTVGLFALTYGQESFGDMGTVLGVAIEIVRRRQRRRVARSLKLNVESRGARPARIGRGASGWPSTTPRMPARKPRAKARSLNAVSMHPRLHDRSAGVYSRKLRPQRPSVRSSSRALPGTPPRRVRTSASAARSSASPTSTGSSESCSSERMSSACCAASIACST